MTATQSNQSNQSFQYKIRCLNHKLQILFGLCDLFIADEDYSLPGLIFKDYLEPSLILVEEIEAIFLSSK